MEKVIIDFSKIITKLNNTTWIDELKLVHNNQEFINVKKINKQLSFTKDTERMMLIKNDWIIKKVNTCQK